MKMTELINGTSLLVLGATILGLAAAGQAHAGATVEKKQEVREADSSFPPPVRKRIDMNEAPKLVAITQLGAPRAPLADVRGFGKNVTLTDALKQVMPGGWAVFVEEVAGRTIDPKKRVSWRGGKPWPAILNDVLIDGNLRATLDWRTKELVMVPQVSPEEVKKAATAASPKARQEEKKEAAPKDAAPQKDQGAEKTRTATVETKDAEKGASNDAQAPAKRQWTLQKGKTLRENLKEWAEQSDWKLVWSVAADGRSVDYPVEVPLMFSGDLIGKTGAVAKVVSLYADAELPLEVEFFGGNKVVEVRTQKGAQSKPQK